MNPVGEEVVTVKPSYGSSIKDICIKVAIYPVPLSSSVHMTFIHIGCHSLALLQTSAMTLRMDRILLAVYKRLC